MNYLSKRQASKLSACYVAYKLGLTLADYKLVERGIKGLSGDKIEVFSNLTNNAETYRFEEYELIEKAKAWYENIDLDRLIEEFGYTRPKLAQTMGVSATKVWDYCRKHKGRISDIGKLEFYIFFKNENNRYYTKNEKNILTNNVAQTYTKEVLEKNEEVRELKMEDKDVKNQIRDIRNQLESAVSVNKNLDAELKATMEAYNEMVRKNKILELRCKAYERILTEEVK